MARPELIEGCSRDDEPAANFVTTPRQALGKYVLVVRDASPNESKQCEHHRCTDPKPEFLHILNERVGCVFDIVKIMFERHQCRGSVRTILSARTMVRVGITVTAAHSLSTQQWRLVSRGSLPNRSPLCTSCHWSNTAWFGADVFLVRSLNVYRLLAMSGCQLSIMHGHTFQYAPTDAPNRVCEHGCGFNSKASASSTLTRLITL